MKAVAAAATAPGMSQAPCKCLDSGSDGNRNETPELIPACLRQGPSGQSVSLLRKVLKE